MCNRITVFWLLSAVVALPDGQSETTKLTGEVGKKITVATGLQVDDEVILFCGPDRRVLLCYHNRTLVLNGLGFHLDIKSRSIIISPLNLNHSGECNLQIIHPNNLVNTYKYEINVTKADSIKTTGEYSHDNTTDQKNDQAIVLSTVFAVIVVIVIVVGLTYGVRSGRIGGNCCSSACRGNCGDNSVV